MTLELDKEQGSSIDQIIAHLGKDSRRVKKKLSEVFHCELSKVPYHLHQAWTRAASWEFDNLFQSRIGHRRWLVTWFTEYCGIPGHGFSKELIEDVFIHQYQSIRTAEAASTLRKKAISQF